MENACTLFPPTRQMPTVVFDAGVGVKAVQDSKDDALLSSIHVLQCGEVRSIAKINKVLVGLRQVPIRTLAACGLDYFGDSNFARWIWELRRKDFHHDPSVKAVGVLCESSDALASGQL